MALREWVARRRRARVRGAMALSLELAPGLAAAVWEPERKEEPWQLGGDLRSRPER